MRSRRFGGEECSHHLPREAEVLLLPRSLVQVFSMCEANDRGYDCVLLEDCTESYFPEFKASAAEMMRAQGANVGWTATSAQLLHALATPAAY